MSTAQPRIRGKALQKNKTWYFEFYITFGDHPEELVVKSNQDNYLSKDAAIEAMKQELPQLIKVIGKGSGSTDEQMDKTVVFDLKNGGATSNTLSELFNKKPFTS